MCVFLDLYEEQGQGGGAGQVSDGPAAQLRRGWSEPGRQHSEQWGGGCGGGAGQGGGGAAADGPTGGQYG